MIIALRYLRPINRTPYKLYGVLLIGLKYRSAIIIIIILLLLLQESYTICSMQYKLYYNNIVIIITGRARIHPTRFVEFDPGLISCSIFASHIEAGISVNCRQMTDQNS